MSGSRALEFLASQGCTTLGNLVLSRRDALLADVRSTVPAEEVCAIEVFSSTSVSVYLPPCSFGLRSAQDARCCQ